MANPILGNVISGVSEIASNLISNNQNKKAQERANRYNTEFWKMQNQYNHPVEQMARLKEAGLNPNLIYGTSPTSAVGNAEKIAPSKAEEQTFNNPLEHLQSFQNVKQQNVTTDNLKSQNDVMIQDALFKSSQTAGNLIKNSHSALDLKLAKELYSTSASVAKENLKQMEQRSKMAVIDTMVKDQTSANLIKQEAAKLQLLGKQISNEEATNMLRKLEITLKANGLENSGPIMRFLFKQFVEDEGSTTILPQR